MSPPHPRSLLDDFLKTRLAARLSDLSQELQQRMLRCLKENRGRGEEGLLSALEEEYERILSEKG